jgi:hypothetical protein
MEKIEIKQLVGVWGEEVICLYCKGVVRDPFRWEKWMKYYCKKWMDLVLHDDVSRDGTKGWVFYKKMHKLDVDETVNESEIKWRSKKFLYASKEFLKKLSLLKFKWSLWTEQEELDPRKKTQVFAYNIFLKHLDSHFDGRRTDFNKEKRVEVIEIDPSESTKKRELKKSSPQSWSKQAKSNKPKRPKTTNPSAEWIMLESGSWVLCFQKVSPSDLSKHLARECPELEEVCQFCNSLIKRRYLHNHFFEWVESYIEWADWEHLLKRGQNIQSHYCRQKEFDLTTNYQKSENLNKLLVDTQNTFYDVVERKTELDYQVEAAKARLEEVKDDFLMRFERKQMEVVMKKIEDRFRRLLNEQEETKNPHPFQNDKNNVEEEKIIKIEQDVVKGVYKYQPRDTEYFAVRNRDTLAIIRWASSICIFNLSLKHQILEIKLGDITKRETIKFVVDAWVILGNNVLIVALRSKQQTKLVSFMIPTMEEIESLRWREISLDQSDSLGWYCFNGRVSTIKNSLLNSEVFYLFTEDNSQFSFQIMQISESTKDEEALEIWVNIEEVYSQKLKSEVLDFWECSGGLLANHLVMLDGRNYEIYRLDKDEYGEINFRAVQKLKISIGILLPEEAIDYYHTVKPFNIDQLLFIGSTKLEIRKISVETVQNGLEYSDYIICSVTIPDDSPVDREIWVQMNQPIFDSFHLFHKSKSSLLEWYLNDESKLDFKNLWDSRSNSTFIFSFFCPYTKTAVLSDLNNSLNFLKLCNVKQEI